MDYNLRTGDLIQSEVGCGIITKRTYKYVHYYYCGYTHKISEEKLMDLIDTKECVIHLGSSTRWRRKRHLKGERDDV